jgi:hypothetical protein
VPALAPKYANKVGKTAAAFAVFYSADGVKVSVQSMLDSEGKALSPGSPTKGPLWPTINLVEFERRVALHNQPTEAGRLAGLVRKFETRLEKSFPAEGPASGSEADIQAWLGTLSLSDRLALLKSQKDWEQSKVAGQAGSKST